MNYAIILAAGQGQRMKSTRDKMMLDVAGKPLVYYSLMAYNDHPDIDGVIVVAHKNNHKKIEELINIHHFSKITNVVVGGLTRQGSSENGIKALKNPKKEDVILVHNGDNALPSLDEITAVIKKAKEVGAAIVGHKVTSTIKETEGEHIIKTHDRNKLFAAETPQAATFSVFIKALDNAQKHNLEVTDEAMMFEAIDQKIALVEASEDNFKVTTQKDYVKLQLLLGGIPQNFRVGIGQDSHMYDEEEMGLTIGGVFLKDKRKLKANSDGDVVLHAVFNALSQAIGDMSLGFYADEECENGVKDSKKYIEIVMKKIREQNLKINSLGIMIECQTPKIDPLVSLMKKEISELLDTAPHKIGITATTGEECTVFGQGKGVQCFAIISLKGD